MIEDYLINDNCGVFGIIGTPRAAELTYFGLYSLQHRGQESAGIVTSGNGGVNIYKGMGEVSEVFSQRKTIVRLRGRLAVGHTRYSTTGASSLTNIQPLLITNRSQKLAVAHNGNLTNSFLLRQKLEKSGSIFQTTSDTELFLHLAALSNKRTWFNRICDGLTRVEGSYSLLFMTENSIIAARDPLGFRPLALGRCNGSYVIASETCAFDIIGAKYIRDIDPGEVLEITLDGQMRSKYPFKKHNHAFCIFEYIYFSRPDSIVFGENVDKIRRRLGRQLAREHPADADIVIAVPDSATTATIGYSEESGIKYEIGLIRNHYVGRTFIDPEQKIRDLDVKVKFNPVRGVLRDKRVVVVDDSIVRGTTSKKLVKLIRSAGAKEIHLRISSPPIVSPCFFGIDMPTREELIASSMSIKQIEKYLEVDSLGYLSIPGMVGMPSLPEGDFCVSCFSGRYPLKIEKNQNKLRLEKV
ncbi:MAG: amidophosphoribosyltransferase [Candidatus Zixiibacteriota bacterium]|nr:MAG: amidophosphoribosyltransferase [candidate division Zixibacteria bacterium]HDL04310.1 amidophosphoribosyltransferase [candidate division Zixibacteria bacterium]